MRTKVHQSREERRVAIQKEIDAISTDIERVRLLVSDVVRNVENEAELHSDQAMVHSSPRSTSSVH